MGFDLGEDRRDVGIGRDHGRIHLLAESMPLFLLVIGGRRAGLTGGFHLRLKGFLLRAERGIGRDRRIVRFVQLLLVRIGQEVHTVMMFAFAGRWPGRGGVGCGVWLRESRAGQRRAEGENEKDSFHVVASDSAYGEVVTINARMVRYLLDKFIK